MVLKIVARILKRHAGLHLVIPLVFGFAVEAMVLLWKGFSWWGIAAKLISPERGVLAGGILAAYLFIMYHLIKKETAIRIGGTDLATLTDKLSRASSYFATSTIGMKEWFDPITQVFVAIIIKRKCEVPDFDVRRVLLFLGGEEEDELNVPYLDGYYARSLADIHLLYKTPLGFLRRKEILEILGELPDEMKASIQGHPWWTSLWPKCLFRRIGRMRRTMPELDFALVTDLSGAKSVLLVAKQGESVCINAIEGSRTTPYEKLVELIKQRIDNTEGGPAPLNPKHDFIRFYYPLHEYKT